MTRLSWRGWLLAGLAGASTIVQFAAWPSLRTGLTAPGEPSETLWALLSVVHLTCSLWALTLIGWIAVGRRSARFAPAALIALIVAAPPATAADGTDRPESFTVTVDPAAPGELVPPASAPAPAESTVDLHEVEEGDTLWAIAAHHLGPEASNAGIAQAVAAWHDTNRPMIGPDADLIVPGQVFTAPQEVAAP